MALFQSFWHGECLPRHVQLCIKSFLDHGHGYHLYSYAPHTLPSGAQSLDARDVLPFDALFYYKNADGSQGSVSAFSNVFRYELLRRKGEWWVDTDVLCLSSQVPDVDLFLGWESENWIGSAIIKAPAGHPLAERAASESASAGMDVKWGQIGPKLLTRAAGDLNLRDLAAPREFAYPVHFSNYLMPVEAEARAKVEALVEGRPFLHLWHEMFRRQQNGTLNAPAVGSFLWHAYQRHLPAAAAQRWWRAPARTVARLFHGSR